MSCSFAHYGLRGVHCALRITGCALRPSYLLLFNLLKFSVQTPGFPRSLRSFSQIVWSFFRSFSDRFLRSFRVYFSDRSDRFSDRFEFILRSFWSFGQIVLSFILRSSWSFGQIVSGLFLRSFRSFSRSFRGLCKRSGCFNVTFRDPGYGSKPGFPFRSYSMT